MKKLIMLCLIATMLVLPLSALALEKMSGGDLDGVAGQAGVTIAFGGTSTTTIAFSSLAWGDPDGCLPAACSNAGWIILDGAISITQAIADGQTLTLDVGTTSADCIIGGVTIPNGNSFIKVGLPTQTTSVYVPATLTIGLGSTSQTIDGTLGLLFLQNLSIQTGNIDALYIWAH